MYIGKAARNNNDIQINFVLVVKFIASLFSLSFVECHVY